MKKTHYHFSIMPQAANQRLDQYLASVLSDYSRNLLQSIIKSGHVSINSTPVTVPKHKTKAQDCISIEIEINEATSCQPQDIPLDIVFEDQDIMVINKPVGLIAHPGAGNPDQTLVNALLHHNSSLKQLPRAGLIHRLDKDTSGLLVIALNQQAQNKLIAAMQQRLIKRSYFAIVQGLIISGGHIDAPIGRHPKQRTKMAVVESGKSAQTTYRVAEKFRAHTAITLQLHTGRTHQIRVHMQYIRHPIVGDQSYPMQQALIAPISDQLKTSIKQFRRQALHAAHLELEHPKTTEIMAFDAPLPQDIQQLLLDLRYDLEHYKQIS